MSKKKSKIIWLIVMLVIFISATITIKTAVSASAQSYYGQTAEDYFPQTLCELGYDGEVTFEIDSLYDESLNENGFEYMFKVGESDGYALMIKVYDEYGNMYYDIMEIFVGATSPFISAVGEKIYIKMFAYIEFVDGNYYDVSGGAQITEQYLEWIVSEGFEYRGYDTYTTTLETVNYSTKYDTSFEFNYGLPAYSKCSYSNGCGSIAGGNILGYYDIMHENIIPNYATGITVGGKWRYLPQTTNVTAVIDELYGLMGIGATGGVTVSNFKNGLSNYAAGKGKSASYNSTMSFFSFDYSSYVAQVNSGYPVAMFYNKFSVIKDSDFASGANYDQLKTESYIANHVMIGSGYRSVSYYNPSGANFRNDSYLIVSTGIEFKGKGFLRMNNNTAIDEAFGVKIQ